MTIKGYIISLIGVILLSILIEVILPNGKMQKYVKAMFHLLILSAIVMPIITFIRSDFNFEKILNNNNIQVDSDFILATNKKIYTELENKIETNLTNIGYNNVKITINFKIENVSTYINEIIIDMSNLKIDINLPHNDKKQDILEVVNKYITLDDIAIKFIEGG